MKCSLFVMTASRVERSQGIAYIACLKEECGQWDKDQKCCSEVSKARAEWALVKVWQEIRDKMPHES